MEKDHRPRGEILVSLQWKNKNSGFISLEDLVPRIVPVVIYEIQYVQYLASKILVGMKINLGKYVWILSVLACRMCPGFIG